MKKKGIAIAMFAIMGVLLTFSQALAAHAQCPSEAKSERVSVESQGRKGGVRPANTTEKSVKHVHRHDKKMSREGRRGWVLGKMFRSKDNKRCDDCKDAKCKQRDCSDCDCPQDDCADCQGKCDDCKDADCKQGECKDCGGSKGNCEGCQDCVGCEDGKNCRDCQNGEDCQNCAGCKDGDCLQGSCPQGDCAQGNCSDSDCQDGSCPDGGCSQGDGDCPGTI